MNYPRIGRFLAVTAVLIAIGTAIAAWLYGYTMEKALERFWFSLLGAAALALVVWSQRPSQHPDDLDAAEDSASSMMSGQSRFEVAAKLHAHTHGVGDGPTRAPDDRPTVIVLTPAEIQSGHSRVKWAQGLIEQLPPDHDGRNSWLLNYADGRNGASSMTGAEIRDFYAGKLGKPYDEMSVTFARAVEGPRAEETLSGGQRLDRARPIGSGLHSEVL